MFCSTSSWEETKQTLKIIVFLQTSDFTLTWNHSSLIWFHALSLSLSLSLSLTHTHTHTRTHTHTERGVSDCVTSTLELCASPHWCNRLYWTWNKCDGLHCSKVHHLTLSQGHGPLGLHCSKVHHPTLSQGHGPLGLHCSKVHHHPTLFQGHVTDHWAWRSILFSGSGTYTHLFSTGRI